ncbi:hypothetical protein NCC78_19015 [Micromonospora phytophila]|uniref:WD40 repeat domain-containing protein n=1 Tax=Micromonospora phytophila TaxID=709888 RepID=UPI0020303490|nr:hypothetical protein [Micromonospora phytophila]MCM0676759.1 hypothetical protein [Micromonospora phytophila]
MPMTSRPRRGAALVALTIVASAVGAVAAPGPQAAPADADAVPVRVHDPWLWQATVGQRPTGPAAMVFFTSHTRYFESTGVLVGRDGGYRLIPVGIGEGHGLLAPDGRHYLRPGSGTLVDLVTGEERRTLGSGITPLAWSPDGRRVLGTRSNDDAVITYGPENQQLNDPEKPDDLVAVDPWTGTERPIPAGTFASHAAAAWSPTGNLVAVAGPVDPAALVAERQRLVLVDPDTGRPRWQVELGDRRLLAGAAAWHPDGRRIALLAFDGCAGPACTPEQTAARTRRIEFVDASTGHPTGAPVPVDGSTVEIIGWRGGDPVVKQVAWAVRADERRTTLAAVTPDGTRQPLVTAPPGTTDILVPGELLARAAFGGPERRPSPFAAPLWLYLTLAVPPLLVATALLLRHRRRRRAAAGPAPEHPAPPTGPPAAPR